MGRPISKSMYVVYITFLFLDDHQTRYPRSLRSLRSAADLQCCLHNQSQDEPYVYDKSSVPWTKYRAKNIPEARCCAILKDEKREQVKASIAQNVYKMENGVALRYNGG